MEQMNKFTLIPSAQQYKSAPANDQEISISLEEKQQELTEYDRSSTVSLADVYDSERQGCTIFRPTFKISYLYGNVITGTTEYLPFKNNLFYVGADASIQNNIWKGFPQYYEFDFFRPNISDQHLDYKAKSAYTYNWTYYVSYAFENNENKILYTTLSTQNSWVAKDGIPFTISNAQSNGSRVIRFECVAPHGLTPGEFVELSFDYKQNNIFEVYTLGNDTFDSQPYVFNIFNYGYTGSTFLNGRVGTFKRVLNPENLTETRSKYYVRKHKIITNLDDLIITKSGFEKNVFNEERKLELSSLTPNNVTRISQKTSSNAYNVSSAIDFNFSGYTDNQMRPLSEIFLTIVFKGYTGWFNEPSNGVGLKQGWKFNITTSPNFYWDQTFVNSNTSVPLSSYTKTNGVTKTFFYNGDLKKDDVMDGDFCEWNNYEQFERVVSPYFHKIKYNQNIFSTTPTPDTNAPGYYYEPHNSMTLKTFSDYIETGDVGKVENVPSYSFFSTADQQFRWRDIYTYGFVDNLGRGVDYPFLNSAHYPYQGIIFRLIPEGSNFNGNLLGIAYPEKPLIDGCE